MMIVNVEVCDDNFPMGWKWNALYELPDKYLDELEELIGNERVFRRRVRAAIDGRPKQ